MDELNNCLGQSYRFTLTNATQGTLVMQGDPVGWEETDEILRRDEKLHGVFWDYTLKLEFYCGNGKEFIDAVFEAEDIDGEIKILIEKTCGCDNDYEEQFTGKLNLSTLEREGNLSRVNIEGEGIAKLVKNRLDTKVNLNSLVGLDGLALPEMEFAPYDLTLHSKVIIIKSKLEMEEETSYSGAYLNNSDFGRTIFKVNVQFPVLLAYDDLAGLASPSDPMIRFDYGIDEGIPYNPDPIFLNDSTPRSLNLKYIFNGTITESNNNPSAQAYNANIEYRIGSVYDLATALYLTIPIPVVSPGNNMPVNIDIDLNDSRDIEIGANEYLWVTAQLISVVVNSGKTSSINVIFTEASIELIESSTTEATTTKAFGLFESLSRVFSSISGQVDAFRSEYFGRRNSEFAYPSNGCGSFAAITNGFLIRGFPIEDTTEGGELTQGGKPVFISGNELFESLNAIHNLGMGVEKTGVNTWAVVVEPKSYFYDPTVLLQLKNIPNLKINIANNYYYNKVTVGYEKWENEQVNGLDEFNSKREYSLPIKSTKNELTILSKLIASGYAIEFTRRKRYDTSRTEDYKYDNDNFIISLNHTTDGAGNPTSMDVAEKDENFPTVNNLISPETSYNLRLSPARNFLRWNPTINTGLLKKPGQSHKFTYGEANYKMESQISDACPGDYNDALLSESQDIQWDGENNNDSSPLWIPLIAEIEYPLTDQEWKHIKANPKGQLEISESETDFLKTYILEIRRKQDGMATFKLLFANDEFTTGCLMDYIDSEYIDCDYIE